MTTSRLRNDAFPRLPVWPLAQTLEQFAGNFRDQVEFGEFLGVSEKSLREWRVERRKVVTFDIADRILCELGLCWWEVWNEDTVRQWAFTVTTYKPTYDRQRPGKLTPEQVEEIRTSPESARDLALRLGVTRWSVDKIRRAEAHMETVAREIVRTVKYGDLGPDWEMLARATFAFTGERPGQLELAA